METSPLEITRLWKHPKRHRKMALKRSENEIFEVIPEVRKIITDIKQRGDYSLLDYTKKFDEVTLGRDQIQVSDEEISNAYDEIIDWDIKAIRKAADAIKKYHEKQLPEDWIEELEPGISAGQVVRTLESVGCYVPGGKAQYPSTVLMTVIPAKVAGVEKTVICTPPNSKGKINPATLIAADIAEADEVYKAGGAQAIAAMAYGTRTIPEVEKIVGPGNIYVNAAKKIVSTKVDIGFMAGPSEVLVLADSSADPRLVAVDLIAQAEHDVSAAAVLVTTSEKLAEAVSEEVRKMVDDISRKRIAIKALQNYGRAVVVKSFKRAIEFVNDYAPEHLEIMVRNPDRIIDKIKNAGAIFVGSNTPTAAGDFVVGPSHVLPTGGGARRNSGLSVFDFIRMPSLQRLTKEGLESISDIIQRIADLEGLSAHDRSVRERLED